MYFREGKPVGQGKCTFYGSEYDNLLLGGTIARCKDVCSDEKFVVSFEGEIEWDRHADCHRLTWADEDDYPSCPKCGSGNYVLTLGNGERWEGELKCGFWRSGPWTRTNKEGTIEEVIQFLEKED